MKMRSRVLAAAVAASLLAACGGGGDEGGDGGSADGGGGSTELSLLVPSYSDNTRAIWEEIIGDFESENSNVTVDLEVQSWDNINDVVRTKIQGNDLPDLLNIDSYAAFAADGLLYPAEEVASEETIAEFQESFVENASIDGTMYGFPLLASTRAMFYNIDLLEEAGYSEPPSTWDELLETAQAISDLPSGVHGYGMPLGNEEAQGETSLWVFGNDGAWIEDGEPTVDAPENVEAVEFMQRMVDEGATQPDAGATDRTPLINVFIQGQIGMIVGLPPTVGEIEEKNPDLNYGTTPIATPDGETFTLGVADHLMAFDTGEDKADAIRAFVDYFFETDTYLKFLDGEGFLPTTKSGAENTENAERFASFLEVLPGAQFYPFTDPSWPVIQAGLQNQVGRIAQGEDPAAVLAEIQARAEDS